MQDLRDRGHMFARKQSQSTARHLGRRRAAGAAISLLLAAGATTASTGPASADTLVQVTCTGTETANFTPGITNTPRQVTNATQQTYGPCVHVNGLQITTWTGTSNRQTQRMASCTELLEGSSGSRVISWSNGQTSTWAYTNSVQIVGGNVVVLTIGEITDGLYEGALAQREHVRLGLVDALVACSTPEGLEEVSGPFTFTITGL